MRGASAGLEARATAGQEASATFLLVHSVKNAAKVGHPAYFVEASAAVHSAGESTITSGG